MQYWGITSIKLITTWVQLLLLQFRLIIKSHFVLVSHTRDIKSVSDKKVHRKNWIHLRLPSETKASLSEWTWRHKTSLTNNLVYILCPVSTRSVHTSVWGSILFVRHISLRSRPALSSVLHSKKWVPSLLCGLGALLNSFVIVSPITKKYGHGSTDVVFITPNMVIIDC